MKRIFPLFFIIALFSFSGCLQESEQAKILDEAEAIIETNYDSALILLQEIDTTAFAGNKEKAKYSLLLSIILDKNYIDTTTFSVLEPALKYFSKEGNPNQKLKTLYYEGRIFQNRNEHDKAIRCFRKALDLSQNISDSLLIARIYVALGISYRELYDYEPYIDNFLKSEKIYKKLNRYDLAFNCLTNALDGAIILNNNTLADSLIKLIIDSPDLNKENKEIINSFNLVYQIYYGKDNNLKELLLEMSAKPNMNPSVLLNMALAYNKIGENKSAQYYLDQIKQLNIEYDTLKYLYVESAILYDLGQFKNAFDIYKDFTIRFDSLNVIRFDQKSKSINEIYQLEIKALQESEKRAYLQQRFMISMIIVFSVVIILLLIVRSQKIKRELLENKNKISEIENSKLKIESKKLLLEKTNLKLENSNLILERDKKILEAENLNHRLIILEDESESLKKVISEQASLPKEVAETIKIRIEMLNTLLASAITDDVKFERTYEDWVKDSLKNKAEFMNSNRLAFKASHPQFIKYFESHGLSDDEINYVCLYALGLRGKDVGNYMQRRSHVNISSQIRKKLGIDKYETNIGIYVRRLLKAL